MLVFLSLEVFKKMLDKHLSCMIQVQIFLSRAGVRTGFLGEVFSLPVFCDSVVSLLSLMHVWISSIHPT